MAQKLEEFVEELKEDGSWEDLPISRESRDTPDSRDSWEKVNRKPKLSIIGPASIITQTVAKPIPQAKMIYIILSSPMIYLTNISCFRRSIR